VRPAGVEFPCRITCEGNPLVTTGEIDDPDIGLVPALRETRDGQALAVRAHVECREPADITHSAFWPAASVSPREPLIADDWATGMVREHARFGDREGGEFVPRCKFQRCDDGERWPHECAGARVETTRDQLSPAHEEQVPGRRIERPIRNARATSTLCCSATRFVIRRDRRVRRSLRKKVVAVRKKERPAMSGFSFSQPPRTGTVLSFPPAKNPISEPSGRQKGKIAPSVPRSCRY
jgi:hypothetical protein